MHRLPELDDAVQDLSEDMARRLVLVDSSMRVVAYSIHEAPQDRKRLSHILSHSDTWPSPRTAKNAHSVEQLPEIGNALFVRLVDSTQHIIGHLITTLTETEKATNRVDNTVMNAAMAGTKRLGDLLEAWQRDEDERAARSHQHTVNLVSGSPHDRASAASELLSDRMLSTAERYCAVALGVDPRNATQQDHEKAALAVSRTVRFVNDTSTATVVGGTLEGDIGVLVFPRPVVVTRLIRILERPPLIPIRAGIGPLTTLNNIHRSFERARLAWRAAWLAPEDNALVVAWDDIGLDGTLARLPLEDFAKDDLPAGTRDLLAQIDSPVLLATLDAYLAAGGDAQQTASALNIHRSTLYYRLDKLRRAIPGDLRDGVLRRELHTGLRIARLARLIPRMP